MRLVLDVVIIVTVAGALLGGCGLLWRPLLPWRARPYLTLLAPFLGLALVSGICHALGAAGLPLARIAWLLIGLAVAGWWSALIRRRRLRWRRELLLTAAVCVLALLLAALPVLALGYLTSVGLTSDAVSYAARAEYLQHAPLQVPAAAAGQPVLGLVHAHMMLRAGDVYLLGLLGLLAGHRSFELLTLLLALFFGLAPGAVFVWARLGLRLSPRVALLAAGLVGINNLVLWAVFDNFLSQMMGLSLFPLLFVFAVEGFRQRGWRSAAVFGALLATQTSVYPVYAVYALASVALYWLVAWLPAHRLRELPRHAAWWLTAAGCALLLNGVALYRSFRELAMVSQLLKPQGAQFLGSGDILVFPSLYKIAGLVSHEAEATRVHPWPLPRGATSLLALVVAAFALYGWWRLAPRLRLAAATLLLAGAALAAHQRFWANPPDGYPYGYFKAVSVLPLEAMVLVAAGLVAAWRRPALRAASGLTALALVALNLMNSLWSADYAVRHTILTRELIAVAQAPAAVPAGAWVLMDVVPSPPLLQTWIGYLWNDRLRTSSRRALLTRPVPSFQWAFVERQLDPQRQSTSTEPWYDPARYSVVWETPRFALRQRRDATLAEMRWEAPLLRRGESLEVELAPERQLLAGTLAGRPNEAELAAGAPRRLRIYAFGAGEAAARLELDGATPVSFAAGGWVLDFDLACRRQPQGVRLLNVGPEDVLVESLEVVGSKSAGTRSCLEVEPLGTGAAYVEQEVVSPRIRYRAWLWPPREQDGRRFHLGVHVANVATNHPLGVWTLRFPPGKLAQKASLEIDLGDGKSHAEIDGRPVPVDVAKLDLERGDFGLSAVLWQIQPVAQVSVDNLLWFNRRANGAISITAENRHAPLTVIPARTKLLAEAKRRGRPLPPGL